MKKVLSMITAATTAIMMFISCNEGQAFTDGEDAGEEFVKTYSEYGNDPVKLKETTVKIIEKATVYMSDSILIQSFLKGARNKMEGYSSETAGAFFGIDPHHGLRLGNRDARRAEDDALRLKEHSPPAGGRGLDAEPQVAHAGFREDRVREAHDDGGQQER